MCETIYYRDVEYDDDLIQREQKRKIVHFKNTWTIVVVCLFVCFNIQNNKTTFNAVRQKNVTCNRTDLLKSHTGLACRCLSFHSVQPSVHLVKASYPLTQNGSKERGKKKIHVGILLSDCRAPFTLSRSSFPVFYYHFFFL